MRGRCLPRRWISRRGSPTMWGIGGNAELATIKAPRCPLIAIIIVTMSPKGPFRLVTVNTAPERAKRLIGRVAEALSDRYTIEHVANCESTSSDDKND
jgi:hypothetical protein